MPIVAKSWFPKIIITTAPTWILLAACGLVCVRGGVHERVRHQNGTNLDFTSCLSVIDSVCAWVYKRMHMGVHERMRMGEHGRMRMGVHGSTRVGGGVDVGMGVYVWIFLCMGARVHLCTRVRVHLCTRVRVPLWRLQRRPGRGSFGPQCCPVINRCMHDFVWACVCVCVCVRARVRVCIRVRKLMKTISRNPHPQRTYIHTHL